MNTVNWKNKFEDWYETYFKNSNYATRMENTVEDSPYHREKNVWVHTQMVLEQYYSRINGEWTKEDFLGALVIAFHDTGKPDVEEVKKRNDGSGYYRSYKTHEQYSGGLWMDYILTNNHSHGLNLSINEIYNAWVMIAYHLPYGFNNEKLTTIKTHLSYYGLVDTFTGILQSDCYGRISDDEVRRNERNESFITKFKELPVMELNDESCSKFIHLICGVSGSGKSTYIKNKFDLSEFAYHSMDQCRLDWYSSDYKEAFDLANQDKFFYDNVAKDYYGKLKSYGKVIVDNTHTSMKQRRKYINIKDTFKQAHILWVPFKDNCERNKYRSDKTIPESVVERMYFNFFPVLLGECDQITKDFLIYADI